MRNVILLMAASLLLVACGTEDDHYYGSSRDSGSYGGNSGYGGNGGNYYGGGDDGYAYDRNGYDRYGYSSYYPYGQRNYPRDRIFIVDNYHHCTVGRIHHGYCYHYDDDYRRALEWDRIHGYDDHWHKRRKDWCKKHDCSRDHAIRDDDGYRDSKGEKQRPVERDRLAQPKPYEQQREKNPRRYEQHPETRKPAREDGWVPSPGVRDTRPPVPDDARQYDERQDNGRQYNDRQHNDRQRDGGSGQTPSPAVNTEPRPDNNRYRQSPVRSQPVPGNQQRDYGVSGRNQPREPLQASDPVRQEQRRSRQSSGQADNADFRTSGSTNNSGKRSRNQRGNDLPPVEAAPDGQ